MSINFISSRKFNSGAGTKLINFAKNYSKLNGCGGYLTLNADNSFTPQRVPHLFYRKLDFASNYENFNDEMDKYIKENRRIENCWDAVPMYLPEDKIQRNLYTIL